MDQRASRSGSIVPTDIGIDQQRRLEEGRSIRRMGEQSAIEALDRFLRGDPTTEALLLFEDTDIVRRRAVVDERVGLISTGDFLRELEGRGIDPVGGSSTCNSTRPAAQGRNVERQRRASAESPQRVSGCVSNSRAAAMEPIRNDKPGVLTVSERGRKARCEDQRDMHQRGES